MNQTAISGLAVRDPEIRKHKTDRGDVSVVRFPIANRDGRRRDDEPNYIDCEAWAEGADAIAERLKKGDLVYLTGYLRQDKWTAPDGTRRSKLVLRVQHFETPGKRREEGEAVSRGRQASRDEVHMQTVAGRHGEDGDDIPF